MMANKINNYVICIMCKKNLKYKVQMTAKSKIGYGRCNEVHVAQWTVKSNVLFSLRFDASII